MSERSIYTLFASVCDKNPEKVAYRYKAENAWHDITWQANKTICQDISKGLMALGVNKDDKVNILSNTRPEWLQIDMATVSIGAVVVGIYASNLPEDCAYIINHSDAVILFAENQDQLDKIMQVQKELPKLKYIVLLEGNPPADANEVLRWEDFLAKGKKISDDEFVARTQEVEPGDLASIVYTSGTTGVPKGAMLTHDNLLFTSWSASESLAVQPHFETLLFLPLAHVFARIIVYLCLREGLTINFAESIEKVGENLKETRPHFFASVPRIFEKVYDKITSGAQDAGGLKLKIFNWSLATGMEASKLLQKKQSVDGLLAVKNAIANKLVFSKIQAALGGRVQWTISGAAPLNITIAEFFHACGVTILEGIGMTENTSFTNVNRYDNNKFGTVGQPGPGVEQRIAEDGEVLYRGRNVMKGYYKNPEATAAAIDSEGWLYTGDIGEIDSEGFLKITDRKKDLIITAGGKNIAPQRVEKTMRTSRYVSQVLVFGDKKKFLTAVFTLDKDQVAAWAVKHGIDYNSWQELCQSPQVRDLMQSEVQEKNKELASFETIKKIYIAPADFSIEGGELTASLKVKRKVVTEKYRDELEALYTE
ncbi:MAG: long-chain fatty acid--CoA ligase [Deferribacteres bacterium]|nr:long-chain fatty acid--CoA ligase [candidate division KSB1 bacterium]MCB9510815.1 long-chain fatty acid--CoA ligase [Deferribacteres bacterium]